MNLYQRFGVDTVGHGKQPIKGGGDSGINPGFSVKRRYIVGDNGKRLYKRLHWALRVITAYRHNLSVGRVEIAYPSEDEPERHQTWGNAKESRKRAGMKAKERANEQKKSATRAESETAPRVGNQGDLLQVSAGGNQGSGPAPGAAGHNVRSR